MNIKQLQKKFNISNREMFKYQAELKNINWVIQCNNKNEQFVSDYNQLTKKGKVAAILGLINNYLKFDRKSLRATKKVFSETKIQSINQ